jgi:hypothetical protein
MRAVNSGDIFRATRFPSWSSARFCWIVIGRADMSDLDRLPAYVHDAEIEDATPPKREGSLH